MSTERVFESLLPPHRCGLALRHNEHLNNYETAEEFLDNQCDEPGDISPEDRAECIRTGQVWTLHWYPDTPVGFYWVAGPTLERVLFLASEVKP